MKFCSNFSVIQIEQLFEYREIFISVCRVIYVRVNFEYFLIQNISFCVDLAWFRVIYLFTAWKVE